MFPEKLIVTVEPTVNEITSGDEATFDIDVQVFDSDGDPIKGANVIISGLGGAGSGQTDEYGTAQVKIKVRLESGRIQGFLDVNVKAGSRYEEFLQSDMIAVVRN